jgi:hypothetical protein
MSGGASQFFWCGIKKLKKLPIGPGPPRVRPGLISEFGELDPVHLGS